MALSQEQILQLAQKISDGDGTLQRLSRKLGYTTTDIAQFIGMNRGSSKSGTIQMLDEWKTRTETDENQCETFVRILKHVDSELADQWFKGIFSLYLIMLC